MSADYKFIISARKRGEFVYSICMMSCEKDRHVVVSRKCEVPECVDISKRLEFANDTIEQNLLRIYVNGVILMPLLGGNTRLSYIGSYS